MLQGRFNVRLSDLEAFGTWIGIDSDKAIQEHLDGFDQFHERLLTPLTDEEVEEIRRLINENPDAKKIHDLFTV